MNFNTYSDLFFALFIGAFVISVYLLTNGARPGLFNAQNQANASDINRYNV